MTSSAYSPMLFALIMLHATLAFHINVGNRGLVSQFTIFSRSRMSQGGSEDGNFGA